MKEIIILGKDDSECEDFYKRTVTAADELQCEYTIQRVTDPTEIMMFGVTLTPAIVINDGVRAMGRIPEHDELKHIIDMVL